MIDFGARRPVEAVFDEHGVPVTLDGPVVPSGHSVRTSFAMMDKGLPGGASDDRAAGHAAAQEALRREAQGRTEQPPPPSYAQGVADRVAAYTALADQADSAPVSDRQSAYHDMCAGISAGWAQHRSQMIAQRRPFQPQRDAAVFALDSVAAARRAADRANALQERDEIFRATMSRSTRA